MSSRLERLSFRLFVAALLSLANGEASGSCDVSEFACDDGGCTSLVHFCDGVAHCPDYSDEPPGCTVCNRTFYGFVGRTYSLPTVVSSSLASSSKAGGSSRESSKISDDWTGKAESSHFVCVLTFSAVGRNHGEIVQINFDDFHVGHFNISGAEGGGVNGCSRDHVTIEEPKGVFRGGRWCGEAVGLNVYYSETDTVVVTVTATTATYGEYFDNPLRFKLKYKFLRREEAFVRHGIQNGKFRGDLVRNTACSRVFQGCRARKCKIQSPNFPGLYPRNVTCYYLIKALPSPSEDLVPVISISQPNDRLLQIGQREHASRVSPEAILRQDRDCVNPEDYVMVYDGGAMRFPLLTKFCGTATLTNITSSGPEMLLVFKSATSGQMNHMANLASGFEFDVRVFFVRRNPNSITSEECEENIKSYGATNGMIRNPLYAMSANTSCKYSFTGRRDEIVWFHFAKYHRESELRIPFGELACRNRLRIYDGAFDNQTGQEEPVLMGVYCDEEVPPLCIRSREKGLSSKPCSATESFISKTSNVVIIQEFSESTSLKVLEYVIHYEFVIVKEPSQETALGPFLRNASCDNTFSSLTAKKGHVAAPKSVFFYGRGGRTNLLCKYTFLAQKNEAIKLNIMNVNFPDRLCKTSYNSEANVYDCIARITGSAILEASETFWNDTKLILACVCDNRLKEVNLITYSSKLSLDFIINKMAWSQDNSDYSFEAEYEFISVKNCSAKRKLNGTNGVIKLGVSSNCDNYPWKIIANNTHHIYMKIPGHNGASQQCQTKNRIVIYDTESGRPTKSLCPLLEGGESVDVFSLGWGSTMEWPRGEPVSIVFKYLHRENGRFQLKWLEVTKEPRPSALESLQEGGWTGTRPSTCDNECPEIAACISKSLWCDGIEHCPSGADEDKGSCLYASIPWVYLVLVAAGLLSLLVVCLIIFVSVRVFQKTKIKRRKKKEAQRLMTQEILIPMSYHQKDAVEQYYLHTGI